MRFNRIKKVFSPREYSRVAFLGNRAVLLHAASSCVAVFCIAFFNASTRAAASQNAVVTRLSLNNWRNLPQAYVRRAQVPAPYRWFASTDPKGRNADYLLLKPNETRRIPLAAGTLLRLWSTSSAPEKTTLVLENKAPESLKIILENRTRVVLLKNGVAQVGEVHEKAFTLYPHFGGGNVAMIAGALPREAYDNVRVLAKDAALVVTNGAREETKFFYQVAIAPKALPRASPSKRTVNVATKSIVLAAGEEKEFWRASTRGSVDNIEIHFSPPANWNDVRLRATWDENEKQNAVDVPLGAFAANFYGASASWSALWYLDDKTLILRAEMPFGKGAKLSLANSGAQKLNASTRVLSYSGAADSSLRFCARFGSSQTQKGKPLEILSAKGSGAFLGLSLGVKPLPQSKRRAFAYLEGNETIQSDGRSYEGTGTEDFFNSAWYFPQKPFAKMLNGLTFKQDIPPQFSAYRLMIPDAVPFQKNLRVTLEHGNRNNTDDLQYSWVAYWYQKAPLNFAIEEAPPQSEKVAANASSENAPRNATLAGSLAVIIGGLAALIFRRRMETKPKSKGN